MVDLFFLCLGKRDKDSKTSFQGSIKFYSIQRGISLSLGLPYYSVSVSKTFWLEVY